MGSKHPTTVKYKGGLVKLAENIGNLRYDALQDFLTLLQEKLLLDCNKDKERGRTKLADVLKRLADHVGVAGMLAEDAWAICKPHMISVQVSLDDLCEKCGRRYCDHESKY